MPGAITHLKVAHKYIDKFGGMDNVPNFYLGSVCPDSVNLNGHAPKEIRWPAHLRAADLDAWEDNAKRFFNENKDKYDASYLLGYILHIITDIVWDREYERPLCTVLLRDGALPGELKKLRWREIDGYELRQKNETWLSEMLVEIKKAIPCPIGTLNAKDIDCWRVKILEKDFDRQVKSNYIDDAFMDSFFDSVLLNMKKIVNP